MMQTLGKIVFKVLMEMVKIGNLSKVVATLLKKISETVFIPVLVLIKNILPFKAYLMSIT